MGALAAHGTTPDIADDWRNSAACLEHDYELFFPIGEGAEAQKQTREATAVCGGCPVREACLDWALENVIEFGVWGGLSEKTRRSMRRRVARGRRKATLG